MTSYMSPSMFGPNAFNNQQNQNSFLQPHTHDPQGNIIPMPKATGLAQPMFQPIGPLGNIDNINSQEDNFNQQKFTDQQNQLNNTGITPVTTGGK